MVGVEGFEPRHPAPKTGALPDCAIPRIDFNTAAKRCEIIYIRLKVVNKSFQDNDFVGGYFALSVVRCHNSGSSQHICLCIFGIPNASFHNRRRQDRRAIDRFSKNVSMSDCPPVSVRPAWRSFWSGSDPASQVYVSKKRKSCEQAGFISRSGRSAETTSQQQLNELIGKLKRRPGN